MVLDTNVFLAHFFTTNRNSPNRRVYRLWLLEKRLQLVVSPEIIDEYLKAFAEEVGMQPDGINNWRDRFEGGGHCTLVNLARRYTESRDPDDNLMLATAKAGAVDYLITNDRDLLDLPDDFKRTLPFAILTPREFLDEFE